jgi:hypothetical protein
VARRRLEKLDVNENDARQWGQTLREAVQSAKNELLRDDDDAVMEPRADAPSAVG